MGGQAQWVVCVLLGEGGEEEGEELSTLEREWRCVMLLLQTQLPPCTHLEGTYHRDSAPHLPCSSNGCNGGECNTSVRFAVAHGMACSSRKQKAMPC